MRGSCVSETPTGAVQGAPRRLMRWEGACLLLAMVVAYHQFTLLPDAPSWWLFAGLLLVPDLSMLGYLAGPGIGALLYNAAHTTPGPIALGLLGVATGHPLALALAVIWLAHIGLDRALGYGLKYPGAFGDTHLGRLPPGKRASP